jgi:large subunit ribosomal protein L15
MISSELLLEKKVLRRKGLLLKVLGNGTINKAITVKADKFSIAAKEAIEKAGGTVEIISL